MVKVVPLVLLALLLVLLVIVVGPSVLLLREAVAPPLPPSRHCHCFAGATWQKPEFFPQHRGCPVQGTTVRSR